jgi:hypothetical protein
MPSELERQVVVEVIPKEIAGLRVNRGKPGRFPLDQGVIAECSHKELVSHTFNVLNDGSAGLAVIFETRARRARK